MHSSIRKEEYIERVKDYFRKGDAGDITIVDMFTDDVELYFPKFGTRTGKRAIADFVQGLMRHLQSIQHYPDRYTYIASADFLVVEGWESGLSKDGIIWPVPGRSEGRFCNVFRFRDNLISHIHIYVDPDFLGQDEDRFFWGAVPPSP